MKVLRQQRLYKHLLMLAKSQSIVLGFYVIAEGFLNTCCTADDIEAVDGGEQSVRGGTCKIVMMTGFESFNVQLYKQARHSPCFSSCHDIIVPPPMLPPQHVMSGCLKQEAFLDKNKADLAVLLS